jgi:4-amino-4-deoxy-L-arabinose transferase-like glycosyltransferase
LVAWGALGVLLAFACFYNLENYPIIWWDEAIFSETAANLSQTGRYAFTIQSPDQLSDLDYRISVGPAVILPVALAYRLQGVNVINGRLVAVAYLLLAMLALYRVARSLCGSATALLSVVLALLGTDVLYWGRSVMGDVPALALFLCSLGCLFHGLDSDSGLSFLGGGLCLGLAFTAKEFYAAAFLPALMGLAYQERADRSRLGKRLGLFCLGLSMPLLAYLALKIAVLGSFSRAIHHFWQQKMLLRHEFFTPLTLGRFYSESFAYLLGHPLFWLGILGGYCLGQRDGLSPRFFLWLANFLLWTLIYLTAVYWYRFALPALFLACPAAAYLLRRAFARMVSVLPHRLGQSFVAVALGGFLLLWYPPAGVEVLGAMVSCRSSPPERLKAFLHDHVAVDCLIETPEYELAFLDDEHRFHLMPEFYFVESDAERVVLLNPRPTKYDFEKTGADILILGSFGKSIFRQVYPPGQVARNWKKIAQVDFYEVYVRRGREHYLARKRNPQLSRTLGPGSPKPESSPLSDVQDYPFYF